jgi:threonyl-tRNA synthetase
MRTRAFVQDDAHIFCAEEQIEGEVRQFCELLRAVYGDFGFPDFVVGFSTRPGVRAGSDAQWDRAEAMLKAAAHAAGLDPRLQPGDGTFYGPKLEFALRDRQGREWQCGTIQLDFVLPERLGAEYVDADNQRRRPAMMHQAVLGSIERFLAMLLEHHGGDLPLWLAPEQLVVASIGEAQAAYAERVASAFAQAEFRVALDTRAERLPRKIVDARENGIPVLLAVGAREAKEETVSLRHRNGRQDVLPLAAAIEALRPDAFR